MVVGNAQQQQDSLQQFACDALERSVELALHSAQKFNLRLNGSRSFSIRCVAQEKSTNE